MRTGQGSPAAHSMPYARATRRGTRCARSNPFPLASALLCLLPLLPLTVATAQDGESDTRVDAELRFVWGGNLPRSYAGKISISEGSLELVRTLSMQADSIGTIRSSNDQELVIHPHRPATFGGADIRLNTSLDAELEIEFSNPLSGKTILHSIAVEELLRGSWIQPLDDAGTRLAVERKAHDLIRFHSDKLDGIVEVGSMWEATISGYRTGVDPGEYTLLVHLAGNSTPRERIVEQPINIDAGGNFAPIAISIPVPRVEGVYLAEISVEKRRFLKNLLASSANVIRRVEFVAFDPNRPRRQISGWKSLMVLNASDARQPGMFAWMSPVSTSALAVAENWPQLNPLADSLREPISSGRLGARTVKPANVEIEDYDCLTLDFNAWLSVPVGALNPDKPHRLRVRVPHDRPNRMVVSIRSTPPRKSAVTGHSLGNDYRIIVAQRECSE